MPLRRQFSAAGLLALPEEQARGPARPAFERKRCLVTEIVDGWTRCVRLGWRRYRPRSTPHGRRPWPGSVRSVGRERREGYATTVGTVGGVSAVDAGTEDRRRVSVDRGRIADFCRVHGICELSLFGSVLRDDFGPDSDIDVLVEFLPQVQTSFFRLSDMRDELSEVFGRQVDLMTKPSLHPYLRDDVLRNVQVLYVAAR